MKVGVPSKRFTSIWLALGFVVIFAAIRIFLPGLPIFRGWEQKFTQAAVEIAKQEIPGEAKRIGSSHELAGIFNGFLFDPEIANIQGPIMVAAWPCKVVKAQAACIRYIWKGQQLTVIVTSKPSSAKQKHGPVSRGGLTAQVVIKGSTAAALVGNFSPDELLEAWPYAQSANP